MTISDEELYRLAKNIETIRIDVPEFDGKAWTVRHNFNDVEALREAVLQRFKVREPRVTEALVYISGSGTKIFPYGDDDAHALVSKHGGYLAKAVITEVMEGE